VADVRADATSAFDDVLAALPEDVGGARLRARLVRVWPGMDAREATASLLERVSALLGRRVIGGARGGASDASHVATAIPVTIDGLGPRGGGAHAVHEFVLEASLRPRAEVALAVADAVLTP
jgi:glutamate carboxypeptidase